MAQLEHSSSRRVGAAAVAVGLALCVVPVSAQAASAHLVCAPFSASGTGQDNLDGTTAGHLSVAGREIGATAAAFTITGGTASVAQFAGPLTFTPDRGPDATLVAQLAGTFDTTTEPATFSARSTSLTGTGALRLVTGSLSVRGQETLPGGAFPETLTGRLCVPVSGRQALERAVG